MKDPTSTPVWQPPPGMAGPPPKVVMLDTPKVRALANGKRHRVPLVARKTWAAAYNRGHVEHLLRRHFPHFTKVEFGVLTTLTALDSRNRTNLTAVKAELGLVSKNRVSRAIGTLAECGFVVNVGSAKVPHLVVWPETGHWHFKRLAESHDRKAPSFHPGNS